MCSSSGYINKIETLEDHYDSIMIINKNNIIIFIKDFIYI